MRNFDRAACRYSAIVTRKRTRRHRERERLRALGWPASGRRRAPQYLHATIAPESFAIETTDARQALASFLSKLRTIAAEGRHGFIDFSRTRRMSAAGTLLLAAELDRINSLAGRRVFASNYPVDHVVAQVLMHVGIFEMLGRAKGPRITAANVKYWRVHSGYMAEGEKADQAMEGYKALFTDPEQKAMYRGLTEAMTNCKQHAYDGPRFDGLPSVEKWWMFSQIDNGQLCVAICDLGLGIPETLKADKAGLLAQIKGWLQRAGLENRDGNMIRGAMAVGMSRTGLENRGKGLPDIRRVLDGLGGVLQIHSNSGYCRFDAGSASEKCENFKKSLSIKGTVMVWVIPVREQTNS